MDATTTRRRAALAPALAAFALLVAGCSLDFNEAIPCETNDNCPSNLVCNVSIGRCEAGQRPADDAADGLGDAGEIGTDVISDAPSDTGSDPGLDPDATGGGDPDVVEETGGSDGGDDTGGDDGGGDACVPQAEVCNGQDDDCNDIPDDGIDCGTCPDEAGMVLLVRDGLDPFCVDLYEASRPDATLAAPGSDETQATSRRGVIAWANAPLATAESACTGAGKRLCTAGEWTEACGGPQGWLYPYNATSYDAATCNGADTPDPDSAGPTGSRINCVSPEGMLDMSGNLEEWVSGGTTRGGAFDDSSIELRCSGAGETPDQATPGGAVGFRCCADAVTSE